MTCGGMKNTGRSFFLGLLFLPMLAFSQNAVAVRARSADAQVVWDRTPIVFVLPLHKERLLSFPGRVRIVNPDPELTTDKIRLYNNAGTLYMTAQTAFSPIVLQVQLLASGTVVMVHLSALARAQDTTSLDVVMSHRSGDAVKETPTVTVNAVSLLRFAAQQFGVPRVATHPSNITRAPMYTRRSVTLYYGGAVQAFPRASWRAGDYTVTAVALKNSTHRTIRLDPKKFVGHWTASAFYRWDAMQSLVEPSVPFSVLTPVGTPRDVTMVFLVSEKPFGESLQTLSPFVREEPLG